MYAGHICKMYCLSSNDKRQILDVEIEVSKFPLGAEPMEQKGLIHIYFVLSLSIIMKMKNIINILLILIQIFLSRRISESFMGLDGYRIDV
jgi:hypothetical protein